MVLPGGAYKYNLKDHLGNIRMLVNTTGICFSGSLQPEAAFEFVQRHINKGAVVKGVYTESRWEYPLVALTDAKSYDRIAGYFNGSVGANRIFKFYD